MRRRFQSAATHIRRRRRDYGGVKPSQIVPSIGALGVYRGCRGRATIPGRPSVPLVAPDLRPHGRPLDLKN